MKFGFSLKIAGLGNHGFLSKAFVLTFYYQIQAQHSIFSLLMGILTIFGQLRFFISLATARM